ncbi:hypothetical protein BCR44DRAFT_291312 [Catenaria anguillulae PL171]|uniref:Uncharacterized protein n=1 Tax=Catenaria anguillulae PL171 TaxID=765915 RepID=A0A1Y2HWW0_9FUNG|nr:hypothetical protein BCR44DRAFT_291312 [Catenaria anguillulae PL171]
MVGLGHAALHLAMWSESPLPAQTHLKPPQRHAPRPVPFLRPYSSLAPPATPRSPL